MVTSQQYPTPPPRDYSLLFGRAATVLAVIAFGGLFWAINGGFSVLGLERLARMFNDAGKIFWAIVSMWRFHTPKIPYLPDSQPVLPWLGVIAASALQCISIYRKIMRYPIPIWMLMAVFALSVYDLATTYFGLDSMALLAALHPALKMFLAVLLTFSVEAIASFAMKGQRTWTQRKK